MVDTHDQRHSSDIGHTETREAMVPENEQNKGERRDSWVHSTEYLLSLIGYTIGPGNILRFPYLTLRNGGGAFLITYFTSLIVSGIPLVLAESYIGQKTRSSCITCWKKLGMPLMKAAGLSMALLSLTYTFIYQATIVWTLYYMAASMSMSLPWSECNQTWNTENCVITTGRTVLNQTFDDTPYETYKDTDLMDNSTISGVVNMTNMVSRNTTSGRPMSAAEEYWQYRVLGLSSGIDELGSLNWRLCVAHLVGGLAVFLCLVRGVRSVGKVVWVTATTPYILLLVFVFRAAFLPGSMEGVKYYLSADFTKLKNPETWVLRFLQIFFTMGLGYGGLHTMASYNKPKHPFVREAVVVPIITGMTSFVSGFVVFSCAGFLAQKSGIPVDEAMSSGPGLAFVSYPEVTSHLPAGPIWAFLFFAMLFMVAIDSLFVSIETCVTSIVDEFGLNKRQKTAVLVALMIFVVGLGLVYSTNAGMYLFQLMDWYYAALGVFLMSALELLAVTWGYGFRRVLRDISSMTGHNLSPYVLVPLWGVILPGLLIAAMLWSLSRLSKPAYGEYVYPDWTEKLGWCLAAAMLAPAVVSVVQNVVKKMTNKKPPREVYV